MKGILSYIIIILFGCALTNTYAQTSRWQDVKLTGKGRIEIYYTPIKHFFEEKDGQFIGIEYELIKSFIDFTEKKYGIRLYPTFKKYKGFSPLYKAILEAPSGVFGLASMSMIPRRLRVLKFSPPYMPDSDIIINSANIPICKDTTQFIKSHDGLTAVTIKNTTFEANIKKLKSTILPNIKIEYTNNVRSIVERMQTEDNLMAYSQIAQYIGFRQEGMVVNRQSLFKVDKIGRGVAFSKKSDWEEPINLFFNDADNREIINQIIKKYLGSNDKSLFWGSFSKSNPSQQEVALLNKEKELQTIALKQKDNRISIQKRLSIYLIIGFALVFVIALTFYYQYHNKRKNNKLLKQKNDEISEQREQLTKQTGALKYIAEELESQRDTIEDANKQLSHKNKKITDSIRSAEVIQQAILPLENRFKSNFSDHFVLYKPKDIVSGDFYWLSDIVIDRPFEQKKEKALHFGAPSSIPHDLLGNGSSERKYCFMATIDCTGHGVPGAFMSMIGFAYLNKIVNENHVFDPAQILQYLHSEIHTGLKQAQTNNDEGMDICLCRIETKPDGSYEVMFAGAKRPLYYITKNELHEIRGNAASIGGWQKQMQKNFETKVVQLNKGDLLYLSTDGFTDTPNPERKNFSTIKFKVMLNEYFHLPLQKQKEVFREELEKHQQDADQRDDITVIGVKL